MNDVVANGAIQAAEAAGVKVGTASGNLIVVGGNCQAPGVKNVEAGKQAATLLMLPVEEGKLTAARVKDYFDGKKPEKVTYPADGDDHQGEHRPARAGLLVLASIRSVVGIRTPPAALDRPRS